MNHLDSNGQNGSQAPTINGASVTLAGIVEKIVPSSGENASDAVQIVIEGAESLYREIRIQNALLNADGGVVALQPGSRVEITIRVARTEEIPGHRAVLIGPAGPS